MKGFENMPVAGLAVIVVILCLFALALVLLFTTYLRYKRLANVIGVRENGFSRFVLNDFAEAYKKHGQEVNTPAIISNSISTKLSGLLLCERFLNNAVSLFVTLGLFGTFLGLSLSVTSLTELIGYSNTSEWLSVLESVGGGLMSALSGMGVAFYTSLVGVACSIILTILRSIFSTQAQREKLEARLELWLDHTVAPTLPTEAVKDDVELIKRLIGTLEYTTNNMERTLKTATDELRGCISDSKAPIIAFNKTVEGFNSGVKDFSEFNYNLRGTVERLDLGLRDLVQGLRELSRSMERGGNK